MFCFETSIRYKNYLSAFYSTSYAITAHLTILASSSGIIISVKGSDNLKKRLLKYTLGFDPPCIVFSCLLIYICTQIMNYSRRKSGVSIRCILINQTPRPSFPWGQKLIIIIPG